MKVRTLVLSSIALAMACGADDAPSSTPADAHDASVTPRASDAGSSPIIDATTTGPQADAAPPARYRELRGVLHVHSAYSHDACDGKGLDNGVPNAPCVAELRAAPCKAGLDFVMLTDHPAFMKDYEPLANLLYDASKGDEIVKDASGAPVANMVSCSDGRKVMFTFGYEGTHTLPLGFNKHPTRFDSYTKDRSLSDIQSLVADLKSSGALVALAHSEEDDISADIIVNGGADAMEWYNPHGNFKTALGGDSVGGSALNALSLLGDLNPFLKGSSSGAHADLVYLVLLPSWPKAGFEKWREVQKSRYVPGVLGSDVHQNVSVEAVCAGAMQVVCAASAGSNSPALALLASGGQLLMSDNRRLDAYERIMRWLQNRVLTKELTRDAVLEAIGRGRSYGLFSVFGDPTGFVFEGQAGGQMLDIGDESKGPVAITARIPAAPVGIAGGPTFDAAAAKNAEVRALLFRTDASGTVEVANASGLGSTLSFNATAPGQYHLEIWMKPKHLVGALGPEAKRADTEYLWLITNPIRVAK